MEDQTQLGQEQHGAQEQTQTENVAPVTSTSTEPTPEQLRAEIAQRDAVLNQLAPFAQEIQELFFDADESERAFLKQARSIYKQQGPSTPSQSADDDKVTYLYNFVKNEEKKAEQQRKASEQEAFQRDYQYAERLVAERPDLKDDNFWAINALSAYAKQQNITLEQAWKKVGSRFAKPAKTAAAPTSLRADAGEIGIPGRSDTQAASAEMNLRDRFVSLMKQGQRGA